MLNCWPVISTAEHCQFTNGEPCLTRYSAEQLLDIRMNHLEMKHDHLDLVVLAKLSVGLHTTSTTVSSRRNEQSEHQRDLSSSSCMQYSRIGLVPWRSTTKQMEWYRKFMATRPDSQVTRLHLRTVKQPLTSLPTMLKSMQFCSGSHTWIQTWWIEAITIILPKRPSFDYQGACLLANRYQVAQQTFYQL